MLPKELKLIPRCYLSKFLFLFTYAVTIYNYLYNKVNYIAYIVYLVAITKFKIKVISKTINKLSII